MVLPIGKNRSPPEVRSTGAGACLSSAGGELACHLRTSFPARLALAHAPGGAFHLPKANFTRPQDGYHIAKGDLSLRGPQAAHTRAAARRTPCSLTDNPPEIHHPNSARTQMPSPAPRARSGKVPHGGRSLKVERFERDSPVDCHGQISRPEHRAFSKRKHGA